MSSLSIVHPDEIDTPLTPVSNMPFDESFELSNSDYISSEILEISDDLEDYANFEDKNIKEYPYLLPPIPPSKDEELDEIEQKTYKGIFYDDAMDMEEAIRQDHKKSKNLIFNGINLGDGKMEYIEDKNEKLMATNAWQAITQTKCWNFVSEDIDSFMFSDDNRISIITEKMEELGYHDHSGCSFGCTMRNMQYLVKNGEEEFKKIYSKNSIDIPSEFIKNQKFLEYSSGF